MLTLIDFLSSIKLNLVNSKGLLLLLYRFHGPILTKNSSRCKEIVTFYIHLYIDIMIEREVSYKTLISTECWTISSMLLYIYIYTYYYLNTSFINMLFRYLTNKCNYPRICKISFYFNGLIIFFQVNCITLVQYCC